MNFLLLSYLIYRRTFKYSGPKPFIYPFPNFFYLPQIVLWVQRPTLSLSKTGYTWLNVYRRTSHVKYVLQLEDGNTLLIFPMVYCRGTNYINCTHYVYVTNPVKDPGVITGLTKVVFCC